MGAGRIKELLRFDNRWELVTQRLLFRGTHLQVYRIGGLEVIVDHRAADAGSIRTCIATDFYSRYLPKMKLSQRPNVLDLGANAGGFGLMLHVQGIVPGKLVCVELNPNTYERLRFNIRSNFPQSEVINAAVVKKAREIHVKLGRGSTADSIYAGASRLSPTALDSSGRAPVRAAGEMEYAIPGRSLDEIVGAQFDGQMIDLCKMDVEGAEDEIVADGESENQALGRMKYLLVEIHNAQNYDRFVAALERFGLKKIDGDGQQRCGVQLFENGRL